MYLMKLVKTNIALLQQQVAQMKALRLDTTALNRTVQNDVQLYHTAATHESYTALLNRTNTQLQLSTVTITQAIPYAGAAKLVQFRQDIALTKSYGLDVSSFQQRLLTDQSALAQAKTVGDYLNVSKQIDADTASIQLPMLQGQANSLLKQFHQEVTGWGSTHKYHDTYNGVSYNQNFAYDQQGIGSDLDTAVQSAQTVGDYQSAIQLLQNDYASLKALEADSTDKTLWNQPHAPDVQMVNTYHLNGSEVVVVSLVEQTMRMYDSHGNLIKAFQVTTGQYAKPTPPGSGRLSYENRPRCSNRVSHRVLPTGIRRRLLPTRWSSIMAATFSTIAGGGSTMARELSFPITTQAEMNHSPVLAATVVPIWPLPLQRGCTRTPATD